MTTTERVIVVLEAIQRGFNETIQRAQNSITGIKRNVQGFNQVLNLNQTSFKAMQNANISMINSGASLGERLRLMTHGARGFRMELLGVMFFGLQFQRLMINLLKPALDVVGAFELFRTTLEILFLPIAIFLLERFFIPLLEHISNLSEGTRFFIGILVIFGAILGMILFLVGVFGLGIGSLILTFGSFTAFLGFASAVILVLAGVFITL